MDEAYNIDKKNSNTIWQDAIHKEMKSNAILFSILDHGENYPVKYVHIACLLIFDVNMDLRQKDQFIASGHTKKPSAESIYVGVVSRKSVCIIAFTLTALKILDIFTTDIQNTYLTISCDEKIMFTCCPKFGFEHKDYSSNVNIIQPT